jgi:fructose-specific phosphotransferase system IIC component
MAFNVTLMAPHGGIWVLPLVGGWIWFLVALAAGVAVSTLVLVTLKEMHFRKTHGGLSSTQISDELADVPASA